MYTLVISYGTGSPGACLMKGSEVKGALLERDFSNEELWTRIFPDNAVSALLAEENIEMEDVSNAVLCGKPFSCFERLINTHMFFFPRSFPSFVSDFTDLFVNKTNISMVMNRMSRIKRSDYGIVRISGRFETKKEVDERAGFKGDVYYVEPVDALAADMAGSRMNGDGIVIVSIGGTMGVRTAGCYRKNGPAMTLCGELLFPNSLSLLCSLDAEGAGRSMETSRLLRSKDDGALAFKSGFFEYRNGEMYIRKGFRPSSRRELDEAVDGVLEGLVRKALRGGVGGGMIFVSDHDIRESSRKKLEHTFGEIDFITTGATDIMKCVGGYFAKAKGL
ncbi:MAG: hypothetical protein PHW14_05575 [Candidatus Omnitrophica bacterium]|nr:hypothetical protein [Candidatus Omnitrophota bacterium]